MDISISIKTGLKIFELNQREFSDEIHVSKSTVNKWCNGKREPTWGTTRRIADFFRVTVSEFISWGEL